MLLRNTQRAAPRRGVILLVVLAMLTLFSIVGLTFVLFSDSTAMSSHINKEAETQTRPDMDPELAMALFLGQLIYDCNDDEEGVRSSMRGHSFGRTMYGANFTLDTTKPPDANHRFFYLGDNSSAYSGFGRYHTTPAATDEHNLVNYQYFSTDGFVRDPERLGTRVSPAALFAPNSYIPANAPYTYCDGNSMFLAYMDTVTGEIKVPSFHRPWLGPAGVGFGTLDPSNPNWNDPNMKNRVMCPHPKLHPNFPKPLDAGGHVKNADWAPGGCDSIWIDIGAPVMTMADGRKYKMLVAPLILDLDGRLNLNVAGNILGAGGAHRSNQGWGGWEMNPAKVLNSTAAPNEWQNLFVGSNFGTTTNDYGRYGEPNPNKNNQILPNGAAPASGTFLHSYAPVDINGMKDPVYRNNANTWAWPTQVGQPSDAYLLASAGARTLTYPPTSGIAPLQLPSWHSFPAFPVQTFGDANPVETTVSGLPVSPTNPSNYPSEFNTLRPNAPNRLLSVQSMHGLLRSGSTGGEFITGDLRLLMNNLSLDQTKDAAGNLLALKRRNQITTLSMDLDRPGVIPYIWDPNDAASRFRLPGAAIATATKVGTTVTITTATAHGFAVGDLVVISGVAVPGLGVGAAGYNGVFRVATPTATTFTYTAAAGVLAAGAGGSTRLEQPIGGPRTAPLGIPFPALGTRGTPPPAGSEFDANWRSVYAQLGRINLNRDLQPYPALTNGVFNFANPAVLTQYNLAVKDRQQLASDILNVLVKVTGALDPATARATYTIASPEYQATRWLAQLAVNIVDYIDEDDYMTPFQFDPGPFPPGSPPESGWVFGVELPRLTLNEAYAQLDNDNSDTQIHPPTPPATEHATLPYRMNVWVEMHNPLPAETFPGQHTHSNPIAQLQLTMNGMKVPVYQVLLADPGLTTGPLSDPANVTGDPDFANAGPTRVHSTVGSDPVNPWGAGAGQHRVLPANGVYSGPNGSDQGFYVLGPQPPAGPGGGRFHNAADNPNFPATLRSAQMSYPVPLASVTGAPALMPGVDIVLQRLACPHLPPNPLPGKPGYNPNVPINPYITTDLLELTGTNSAATTQVWDSRRFHETNGAIVPPVAQANRHSFGRFQPYAASHPLQRQTPTGPPANPANEAQSTFFRHNSKFNTAPATIPIGDTLKAGPPNGTGFDWLTHLDRVLISPMELLNVSAVKPHELTFWFQHAPPPPTAFDPQRQSNNPSPHLANWRTEDSRLYRFFEFASTGSLQNGYALGGRVPGKININTIGPNDREVFRAMMDAQQGNTFYQTVNITSIASAGTNVTVTTNPGHGLTVGQTGQSVTISGVGVAGYNGQFTVTSVPNGNTFTVTNPAGPLGAPGPGGTVAVSDSTVADAIFDLLIRRRTLAASKVPGPGDHPFLSVATGHNSFPAGGDAVSTVQRGLDSTPLGASLISPNQFMFEATNLPGLQGHPYQRYELLNKIYNNLTVRSNVFAVWMTVGFFEVEDEKTVPVTLGVEIGRAENRHVRHRMFAIVDRTNLQMASTNLKPGLKWTVTGQTSFVDLDLDGPAGILVAVAGTNTASNLQWRIQPGTILTVNPNTNAEENVTVFLNQTTGRLQARFFKGHGNGNPNPAVANAAVIIRGNSGPRFRYNPRSDTNVVPYFAIID
jgi:hypothetical protein